jgi:hypothetical protein
LRQVLGHLTASGFQPGYHVTATINPFFETQDGTLGATAGHDPAATCARQYVVTPIVVPAHQNGLKSSLTKDHRHGVFDVSWRYVAMLINLPQRLDQSHFVRVCHNYSKMISNDAYFKDQEGSVS